LEEKHQTVQGETVKAREYLERAASASEAGHSELGKDKDEGRWRRGGNQSSDPTSSTHQILKITTSHL